MLHVFRVDAIGAHGPLAVEVNLQAVEMAATRQKPMQDALGVIPPLHEVNTALADVGDSLVREEVS